MTNPVSSIAPRALLGDPAAADFAGALQGGTADKCKDYEDRAARQRALVALAKADLRTAIKNSTPTFTVYAIKAKADLDQKQMELQALEELLSNCRRRNPLPNAPVTVPMLQPRIETKPVVGEPANQPHKRVQTPDSFAPFLPQSILNFDLLKPYNLRGTEAPDDTGLRDIGRSHGTYPDRELGEVEIPEARRRHVTNPDTDELLAPMEELRHIAQPLSPRSHVKVSPTQLFAAPLATKPVANQAPVTNSTSTTYVLNPIAPQGTSRPSAVTGALRHVNPLTASDAQTNQRSSSGGSFSFSKLPPPSPAAAFSAAPVPALSLSPAFFVVP